MKNKSGFREMIALEYLTCHLMELRCDIKSSPTMRYAFLLQAQQWKDKFPEEAAKIIEAYQLDIERDVKAGAGDLLNFKYREFDVQDPALCDLCGKRADIFGMRHEECVAEMEA